MAEGTWWPENWTEFFPNFVWGVLILAFGFVLVESVGDLFPNPIWRAVYAAAGILGLTAMLIYRAWLLERFKSLPGGAVVAAIITLLLVVAFSPYVEQQRWPFSEIIANWSIPKADRDAFDTEYAKHKSRLGDPLGAMTATGDVYYGKFDQANTFWIKSLLTIYAIPLDEISGPAVSQKDADWDSGPPEAQVRALLGVPPDRLAPRGGIAKHWISNPDKWKWIGWLKWECAGEFIYFREFENGVIAGPFRLAKNTDVKDGQIFTLFYNGQWDLRDVPELAPKCTPYE